MATKLEGGGGKALVPGPLKNNFIFLRLPLLYLQYYWTYSKFDYKSFYILSC